MSEQQAPSPSDAAIYSGAIYQLGALCLRAALPMGGEGASNKKDTRPGIHRAFISISI